VADDDDPVARIKRTTDRLEKVKKESAAVRRRAENGLRASRPRSEPIKEQNAAGPKKRQK
jgi:hypothetical protein